MKHLRKLLCIAVAMLWVLPVSAMEWDYTARADLDETAPELKTIQPMSTWIAINRDELDLFDAAHYQVNFELYNASFVSDADELVIQSLNEDGSVLSTSPAIDYTVDDTFVPNVLTIASGSQTTANNFVANAHQDTRQIRIIPTLAVSVQDCGQQVRMESELRWADARVASDKPDDLVIPSVFLTGGCP